LRSLSTTSEAVDRGADRLAPAPARKQDDSRVSLCTASLKRSVNRVRASSRFAPCPPAGASVYVASMLKRSVSIQSGPPMT
jgi:hypothetical protein